MLRYTCVIIEDEPLAQERAKDFVGKIPFLKLEQCFDNALDALAYLALHPVDLLFLDIHMDEMSGIELLESSKIKSQVIITTAYQEYALKGYELQVSDYLLKPFTFNRFLQAVTKAHESMARSHLTHTVDYLFVKTENRLEKVNLADILYIEGMRDYRRIHTATKKIMTLQNFGELEHLIPTNRICRVHKSYMVSLDKIETIERSRITIAGMIIPISETYRAQFFNLINHSL